MGILAVLFALSGCAAGGPTVQQLCAEESKLAPLAPLVSAADLAIPGVGPLVAAANTALVAAANGACMNPAEIEALISQLRQIRKTPVPAGPKP